MIRPAHWAGHCLSDCTGKIGHCFDHLPAVFDQPSLEKELFTNPSKEEERVQNRNPLSKKQIEVVSEF